MRCWSTIQLAVFLQNRLACIPILKLGALHTLAEGEAPMGSTNQGWAIGEAE